MELLKTGPWKLSELYSVKKNDLKVFSCFHCGGGSTMGYKLSGYTVLGGVEIDPKMMAMYRKNHNPKHSFLMGVQEFNQMPRNKIPEELFNIDVLDGSPPCSSFSMAGSREAAWGKKKKFREGQSEQILDDLFFHFIETARILRPKVVISENVRGLVMGNARGYVKQIFQMFRHAGYTTQLFLLNSAAMGVPQARERTFFISTRTDLNLGKIDFKFNEAPISFSEATADIDTHGEPLNDRQKSMWEQTPNGKSFAAAHVDGNMFSWVKLRADVPTGTATSGPAQLCPDKPNHISDMAQIRIQSFPDDYDFNGNKARYVCGMSVPPFMMNRVSKEVARQFFGKN